MPILCKFFYGEDSATTISYNILRRRAFDMVQFGLPDKVNELFYKSGCFVNDLAKKVSNLYSVLNYRWRYSSF